MPFKRMLLSLQDWWIFELKLDYRIIKRCPFCKGICRIKKICGEFSVECIQCEVSGKLFATRREAIRWWCHRKPPIEKDGITSCPFCGGHDIVIDHYSAGCVNCMINGPENTDDLIASLGGYCDKCLDLALDKWSHRLL